VAGGREQSINRGMWRGIVKRGLIVRMRRGAGRGGWLGESRREESVLGERGGLKGRLSGVWRGSLLPGDRNLLAKGAEETGGGLRQGKKK